MARRSRRVKTTRRPPRKSTETAYQRRIRRYQEKHPGASKQEARGKGVEARRGGEHRQRIIKEKAKHGGLTLPQIRSIEHRAAVQAKRIYGRNASPANIKDVADRLKGMAREQGYGAFLRYRATVDNLGSRQRHRERQMIRGRVTRFTRERLADPYDLVGEFDLADDDDDLFWYH